MLSLDSLWLLAHFTEMRVVHVWLVPFSPELHVQFSPYKRLIEIE